MGTIIGYCSSTTCPWLWSGDNIAVDPVVSCVDLQGPGWRWTEDTRYTLLLIQSVLDSSLWGRTNTTAELQGCSNKPTRKLLLCATKQDEHYVMSTMSSCPGTCLLLYCGAKGSLTQQKTTGNLS